MTKFIVFGSLIGAIAVLAIPTLYRGPEGLILVLPLINIFGVILCLRTARKHSAPSDRLVSLVCATAHVLMGSGVVYLIWTSSQIH